MRLTTLTIVKITLMKRASTFNNSEEKYFLSMRCEFQGETLNIKGGATKPMIEVSCTFCSTFYDL